MEVVRIIEDQSALSSYRATQNEERALQLELLIESTKPHNPYHKWHPLIATPFRYSPPHPEVRFRPRYGKNVFYSSLIEETALYEHAFHFIKERMHLKELEIDTGFRTIFFVEANENDSINIRNHPDCFHIMNKNDYSASHQFIRSNPNATFIIYPSCRDPKNRDNAAILDINRLEKNLAWQSTIKFFYDNKKKEISWLDYYLHIQWDECYGGHS